MNVSGQQNRKLGLTEFSKPDSIRVTSTASLPFHHFQGALVAADMRAASCSLGVSTNSMQAAQAVRAPGKNCSQ